MSQCLKLSDDVSVFPKMPLQGYNIGHNQSYDFVIRHTAQTTERLNLSDFVKAVRISTALKWHADMSVDMEM